MAAKGHALPAYSPRKDGENNMDAYRRSKQLSTVFGTLGLDENSATSALGWTLSQSAVFARAFLRDIFKTDIDVNNLRIDLQRHGKENGGYTDIEISAGSDCHLIVEAKVGWVIPTTAQLKRYAPRIDSKITRRTKLVSLTAMSGKYVELPAKIGGIETAHRSWEDVVRLAHKCRSKTRDSAERLWLGQLASHLESYMQTQDILSSLVYVVPLNTANIFDGEDYSWADVVYKEPVARYFHPVGGSKYPRFPKTPQNYIGFRLKGKIQSVHFVTKCEVVVNLNKIDKRWPKGVDPAFLYTLGPAMIPAKEIRSGGIFGTASHLCAIDTLLSGAFKTVAEAVKETDKRRKQMRLND